MPGCTGKISYATADLASFAMYEAQRLCLSNKSRPKPIRYYYCSYCERFHLTSKECILHDKTNN